METNNATYPTHEAELLAGLRAGNYIEIDSGGYWIVNHEDETDAAPIMAEIFLRWDREGLIKWESERGVYVAS